jgi:galactose oxidase
MLCTELWDPDTEKWTLLETNHQVPRTYHSIALLLPDATVLTGGGGLCGAICNVAKLNHPDVEIFYPPYLFHPNGVRIPDNARPSVNVSTTTAKHGDYITVKSNQAMRMVSIVRFGSVTHTVNTDQRRIELCGPNTEPCGKMQASLQIPQDPGVALGGNWMVFALNEAGVPSKAKTLLINGKRS